MTEDDVRRIVRDEIARGRVQPSGKVPIATIVQNNLNKCRYEAGAFVVDGPLIADNFIK